jgi:uncharacterized protein YdaU (DUF1376 family)
MKPADRWFPLYIPDFVAGVLDLSREEIASYVLLLFHQWTTRRPLPADEQTLANIARCNTLEDWRRCAPRILAKFRRVADGYLQVRLATERHEADRRTSGRADAGRAGAAARWKHSQEGEPYLPGLEPVDNSPAADRVESAAAPAELHNTLPDLPPDMAKHGKRMANAWQTHGPVPGPIQALFERHARQTSRACARVAHAHAHRARARAHAREAEGSADELRALVAARDALQRQGVPVQANDPVLAELVAAGVSPAEFAAVGQEVVDAIRRGRDITSPSAWALATLSNRRREAMKEKTDPPLDWHATRAGMDRRARELGLEAWGDYEADHAHRGIPPRFAEWLRAVEIADAAVARVHEATRSGELGEPAEPASEVDP